MKGERARGAADMVGSDVNAVVGTNEWVALNVQLSIVIGEVCATPVPSHAIRHHRIAS